MFAPVIIRISSVGNHYDIPHRPHCNRSRTCVDLQQKKTGEFTAPWLASEKAYFQGISEREKTEDEEFEDRLFCISCDALCEKHSLATKTQKHSPPRLGRLFFRLQTAERDEREAGDETRWGAFYETGNLDGSLREPWRSLGLGAPRGTRRNDTGTSCEGRQGPPRRAQRAMEGDGRRWRLLWSMPFENLSTCLFYFERRVRAFSD